MKQKGGEQVEQIQLKREGRKNQKDRLKNLHKLLDGQIETVNKLFEKDNGFEQIQQKLKLLEVKLNTIKQDNHVVGNKLVNRRNSQNVNNSVQSNTYSNSNIQQYSYEKPNPSGQIIQNISNAVSYVPLESLAEYKKYKNDNNHNKPTNGLDQNIFHSHQSYKKRKKLNFDQAQDQYRLSSKKKNKKDKLINKIKSQKTLGDHGSNKKRATSQFQKYTKSVKHTPKSTQKLVLRQNSQKNHKFAINRQQQIFLKRISELKSGSCGNIQNLRTSLTNNRNPSKLKHKQKDKEREKDNVKEKEKQKDKINVQRNEQQQKKKQKIKQMIQKAQTKRLQKQLQAFKLQNKSLQQQINQLKSYKHEYQKIKIIFDKQQKSRRSKKRL